MVSRLLAILTDGCDIGGHGKTGSGVTGNFGFNDWITAGGTS
jgi:hypothetical protein